MKLSISSEGGPGNPVEKTTEIDIIQPYDFILHVGESDYRFSFNDKGDITIALTKNVDAKITTFYNYPAIKLTQNNKH